MNHKEIDSEIFDMGYYMAVQRILILIESQKYFLGGNDVAIKIRQEILGETINEVEDSRH